MNQLTRISIVTVWMLAPPTAAAQTPGARLPGWIARPVASTFTSQATSTTSADKSSESWRAVMRIQPDQPLVVTVAGRASAMERLFVQADDRSISLLNREVSGASVVERVNRDDVVEISVRQRGSAKAAVLGVGIGAGAGLGAGYISLVSVIDTPKTTLTTMAYHGRYWMPAAGAVIGYLISRRHARDVVIYKRSWTTVAAPT